MRPERVYPPWTDLVRCHRVRDPGTDHSQHPHGKILVHSGQLVDQGLCHRGYPVIPHPGLRSWDHVDGQHASMGQDTVIAGLVIQVVMFALFIITAVVFQVRMHHYSTREAFDDGLPWKRHLYTLYAVSLLIIARSIFRVVEYAMGQKGYPLIHEWTLYVFDALLMFIVMVIYGVFFPSELQQRPKSAVSLEESVQSL